MVRSLNDAIAVRARIAEHFELAHDAPARVGEFVLRASQREAVASIEQSLRRFGGALLADPPGSGKTIIALSVADRLDTTALVLAPSTLRAHWHTAAARAARHIEFVSLESLSRGVRLPTTRLIIVDEAHHLRTPTTARYAALAAHAVGRKLVLLSGTPVVNRPADRDALLALFLGSRAASLGDAELVQVLVRRRGASERKPTVRRLPSLAVPDAPDDVGEKIRDLPPPFPVADGRAATALLRVTLGLAWRSSLAALDRALARRVERGAVLAERIAAGVWPTRSELRRWLLGDDGTQLALPLETLDASGTPPAEARETISAHCDAARRLRAHIAPFVAGDTAARATGLLDLLDAHPTRRVACFFQHAATVRALWSALRFNAGVVAITGHAVRAAAGRWTRDDVLRALGKDARPLSERDPLAVRLLLTTDLLAEGVEMPGVGIVVHGDAAWTPARLEQRVGRAARDQGSGATVFITGFRAPRGTAPLLALGHRLAAKRRARGASVAAARGEEKLRETLKDWYREPMESSVCTVATVRGRKQSFLARLVADDNTSVLVCGWRSLDRWHLSTSPQRLNAVASWASACALPSEIDEVRSANRAIERFARRRVARAVAPSLDSLSSAFWRHVRVRVERALAAAPLRDRGERARRWSEALHALARSPGIGAQREVTALNRRLKDDYAFAEALPTTSALWDCPSNGGPRGTDSAPLRLHALLLIRP